MVDEDVEEDAEGPHLQLGALVGVALQHLGATVLHGAVEERERRVSGRTPEGNKLGAILKNDVYKIFGILDPLPPPCLHFSQNYSTKSTQPPLLRLHFVNPPPPSV